jgi:hypothetical protein
MTDNEQLADFLARNLSYVEEEIALLKSKLLQNPDDMERLEIEVARDQAENTVRQLVDEINSIHNDLLRSEPYRLKRQIVDEQKQLQNKIIVRVCNAIGYDSSLEIMRSISYSEQLKQVLAYYDMLSTVITKIGSDLGQVVMDETFLDENQILIKQFMKVEEGKPISVNQMVSLILLIGKTYERNLRERNNARSRSVYIENLLAEQEEKLAAADKKLKDYKKSYIKEKYVVMQGEFFVRKPLSGKVLKSDYILTSDLSKAAFLSYEVGKKFVEMFNKNEVKLVKISATVVSEEQ